MQYRKKDRAYYGDASRARLSTCHSDLQRLFKALAEDGWDIAIVCGHRTEEAQSEAYANQKSRLSWPHSRHNKSPSIAIDAAPWINGAIPWDADDSVWIQFAGIVMSKAAELNIDIIWGGLFRGLKDLNHFELALE